MNNKIVLWQTCIVHLKNTDEMVMIRIEDDTIEELAHINLRKKMRQQEKE